MRRSNLLAVFFLTFGTSLFALPQGAQATCVNTLQAQTIAAAATPTPAGETPTVTVLETCGGDDVSYQVPVTATITYDGQQFSAIYATTNSVITFGRPDNTYWQYPATPSISVNSMDWVAYPNRGDEHFIIQSSDGGFQVDMSARPYGWSTSVAPTSIIVTAAISTDGTVAISYVINGPEYDNTRTGAVLNNGTVVTLEQAGATRLEVAPVLAPTPEPTPLPVPSPEPSPVPTPVEPTPVSPEPTPTPSPEPSVEPSPVQPVEPAPSPSPVQPEIPTPAPSQPSNPESNASPTPSPEPITRPEPRPTPVEPVPEPVPEPEPIPDPPPAVEEEPPAIEPEPPAVEPEPPVVEPLPPEPVPEPEAPNPEAPSEPEVPETPTEQPVVTPEVVHTPEIIQPEPEPTQELPEVVVLTEDTKLDELPPDTPIQLENGVVLTAEVVVALQLLENPAELLAELFTDPGQVLTALSNIGADMSPEVREQSEKVVVSAIIAGGIATQAAASAAATAAYRRKP